MTTNNVKYDTELDWMQHRQQVMADGFFVRDGLRHEPLYLDSDTGMLGYDLYVVPGIEIVMEKWERTPIASHVIAETKTLKMEFALPMLQQFDNWLQEHRSSDAEETGEHQE